MEEGRGSTIELAVLGAQIFDRDIHLEIYLPTKDSNGHVLLDHALWVDRAEILFCMLFGGATRESDAEGLWLNPETRVIIRERTARVYSFTSAERFAVAGAEIREFLHKFGKLTGQGEVAFSINSNLIGITRFDS